MIEVTGLSSVTDTESLRVSGLGDARLLVVNCLREQFAEISESDPIRALKFQKQELQAERDARKAEIEILKGFGGKLGDKPDLTPDQASAFAETLFKKTLACAETVKVLDAEILEIRRKISKTVAEKAGTATVKAVITIVANDDGPVQLKLTYRQSQFTLDPSFIHSLYFQVLVTPPGLLSTTCMPLRKTRSRRSLCPFTTASTCNRGQGRTGTMQS